MSCSCCCYFTPHCTGTPGRHDRYPRTTKLEQVCRRPRGRSECRRVTPQMGLQPGARILERTVPRVCVGSATGAETAPRITREWRWNGPQPVSAHAKWKIEKLRFSALNTAPSPDFCPRMLLTFLGPNRPNAGPTPAPLPHAYQKKPAPQCFRTWGFEGTQATWPPWGVGRGRGQAVLRAAKLSQPDACGRLQPLRQGL